MSEPDPDPADASSDSAVAEILGPALDEIRWRYPSLRVTCSAFVGGGIRVLTSNGPTDMSSLAGAQAVGAAAAKFADLLEGLEQLIADDAREDTRLCALSLAVVGPDTRATAIVPLHAGEQLVGFLRLDCTRVGEIGPRALEQLHDAAPLGSVALALEREKTRTVALIARACQLRITLSRRAARKRDATVELRQAVIKLHDIVEQITPKLEPTARGQLASMIRSCEQHVDAAVDSLSGDSPRPEARTHSTLQAPSTTTSNRAPV